VRKEGWLQLYRQPALLEAALRHATQVAQAHGLDWAALDGAALVQLEPGLRETPAGAIHWRDPWTISDPGALVEHYAALFVQRGGRIAEGDADSLQQTGLGWRVQTRDGALEAEAAVLALGPGPRRTPADWATGCRFSPSGDTTATTRVAERCAGLCSTPTMVWCWRQCNAVCA
jgi:glycine/D-amino acid oxidase-like deaminating enzyme